MLSLLKSHFPFQFSSLSRHHINQVWDHISFTSHHIHINLISRSGIISLSLHIHINLISRSGIISLSLHIHIFQVRDHISFTSNHINLISRSGIISLSLHHIKTKFSRSGIISLSLRHIHINLISRSGIISLIGCGLIQAHYAFKNISGESLTTVSCCCCCWWW